MVLRIIAVSILLLLIPAGFGSVLAFRYNRIERSDILSIYTYGICLFYAAFSVIAIGMTMLRRPFHEAVIAGKLLSGVSLVLFVLMCAMRWKTERLGSFFRWLVHIRRLLVRYWWILLPAGVILFQIIRSVIRTTSVYSDDDTYMSIILDMIRTDTLLGTDPYAGCTVTV